VTQTALEEKWLSSWHHVFATPELKVDNYDQLLTQIKLFRDKVMVIIAICCSTSPENPTMISGLDNQLTTERGHETGAASCLSLFQPRRRN